MIIFSRVSAKAVFLACAQFPPFFLLFIGVFVLFGGVFFLLFAFWGCFFFRAIARFLFVCFSSALSQAKPGIPALALVSGCAFGVFKSFSGV